MNKEWSEQNKKFQSLLKKATFSDGIAALLELRNVLMNEALSWKKHLAKEDFCAIPFINADGYHSKTIAYSLWHIFRIEDIVLHTLIKNDEEVIFAGNFQQRMNSPIITTGNELVKQEIADFSQSLNLDVLYEYILAVKDGSDSWLKTLGYADLKTRFTQEDKERIRSLNVVSTAEEAEWLIDYWGDKDLKGLLQMPFSRHWIMHIEASLRIMGISKKTF